MKPFSPKPQIHVESRLRRWAYVPVMAITVLGIVLFRWPWMAWHDRRLRRACAARWGDSRGRVVVAFEPGTPWHEAITRHWIPRYGDRTSLIDLSQRSSTSRSVEERVYRRFKPLDSVPAMIAVPAQGRVSTVTFAEALPSQVALERRLLDVARLAYGE
jgi:hypothetical protein